MKTFIKHWRLSSDAPHAVGLLCARRERPCRRIAETYDELRPSHQRSPTAGSTAYRGRGCMSGLEPIFFAAREATCVHWARGSSASHESRFGLIFRHRTFRHRTGTERN